MHLRLPENRGGAVSRQGLVVVDWFVPGPLRERGDDVFFRSRVVVATSLGFLSLTSMLAGFLLLISEDDSRSLVLLIGAVIPLASIPLLMRATGSLVVAGGALVLQLHLGLLAHCLLYTSPSPRDRG